MAKEKEGWRNEAVERRSLQQLFFVRDFFCVGLFSQPAASFLEEKPGLLTFCVPKRRDPWTLAESAEQMPSLRQRPWGFCNILGRLPTIPSVLTVHRAFRISDLIYPPQHPYVCVGP